MVHLPVLLSGRRDLPACKSRTQQACCRRGCWVCVCVCVCCCWRHCQLPARLRHNNGLSVLLPAPRHRRCWWRRERKKAEKAEARRLLQEEEQRKREEEEARK